MKSDTSVSGQSFKAKKPRPGEDEALSIRRPRASKVFNRVQREKGSSGGGLKKLPSARPLISHAHPVRPSPRGPALRSATRRCTVKVSYVANRKAGQWAAHGKYLEREGAQKEGELGAGFNAGSLAGGSDDVSLASEMHKWQMDGDQRLFKIVVSPEDGDRMQLKEYTREFMARLQTHVGKDLEWAAIDHYNTGHPHTHVVLRGKDNLQISPDLIRHGMRKIAEDIATERLGYKSELEIQKSREKEIDARQFTGIDRDIEKRQMLGATPALTYVTEGRLPPDTTHAELVAQRLRIRRLEVLERLGVAEKVGSMTWALDQGWDKALKDLQTLQQRTAMVAQGRALMTDPRCPAVVTKIKPPQPRDGVRGATPSQGATPFRRPQDQGATPGDHLVGRVLGTGIDEQFDRSFILIEGTDSRVHIVYQNNAIEKERAAQKLQPRSLIAISGKSFEDKKTGKTVVFQKVTEYDLSIPDQHFKSVKIPEQALDDALDAGVQPSDAATTGFQAVWHQQLRDRQIQREREKALKKTELQQKKEKAVEKTVSRGKDRGLE